MVEITMFRNRDATTLEPGSVLFSEGDDGDAMFAVVAGELELTRNDQRVEVVGAGGVVGELALIDHAPRSATATAHDGASVVRIDQRDFLYLVQEHPTFALQIMAVMAERLRATTERANAD